jgi:drug/metabolite transporter (DMT)-like permease
MTQNKNLGLSLAALTLLMWGSLPLQLKILITRIDPTTLTWYRFTGAILFLVLIGGRTCFRDLRDEWSRRVVLLLLLGGTGLTCNYLLYLKGLDNLTPSTAQIVMQTVPFMVLGGGILIFRESFAFRQWWGVGFLAVGSVLFFNQDMDQFTPGSSFVAGIGYILLSAVSWTVFLLAQKALLDSLKSRTIMLCCYLTGSIVLGPSARIDTILYLPPMFLILVFSVTLIAVISYLTFSTAMRHVPATTAGLTIANIPLITLLFMSIFGGTTEHLAPESLNTLALVGAFLVVVGSTVGALGRKTEPPGHEGTKKGEEG